MICTKCCIPTELSVVRFSAAPRHFLEKKICLVSTQVLKFPRIIFMQLSTVKYSEFNHFPAVQQRSRIRLYIGGQIIVCKHYRQNNPYKQGLIKQFPTLKHFQTMKLNTGINIYMTAGSLVSIFFEIRLNDLLRKDNFLWFSSRFAVYFCKTPLSLKSWY